MHINNAQIQKVLELHLHRVYTTQNKSGAGSTRKPDELVLSARAAEIQEIKQAMAGLPAMREEIVQELKRRIQSGDYKINPEELADKMLAAAVRRKAKS